MITDKARKFSRFPELTPDNYTELENESDLFVKQTKSDKLLGKKRSLVQIRQQFAIIVNKPNLHFPENHRVDRPTSGMRARSENRINPS